MIPNLQVLGSLVTNMHAQLSHLFYLMLPVAMGLSVAIGYLKSGEQSFPDILKRAIVASILLVSFPEVSTTILDICDGIASKIDNMKGLDTFLQMAQEKSQSYATAKNVLLLKFDDIFIAVLSFGSFILLLIARYITIALYYFYWVLLSILSPLLILCYVFPSTARITANLYRGLIEVAAWKILWAVMSAMLASLSFGNVYQTQGSYITLTVMNFVIAIALLFTPLIVKSLIGEGVQATAQTIGTTAAVAMVALPARIATVHQVTKQILSDSKNYAVNKIQSFRSANNQSNTDNK
jgi:hypothetical protein